MNHEPTILDFFLGSNTPAGFVSLFDQLTQFSPDELLLVVKGGPGTGKSTLIQKCITEAGSGESLLERIHCSSDPESLDAALFHHAAVAIADGTPPHVIEPQFPGAYESVVNLCDCWDEDTLRQHQAHIVELSRNVSACHRQCVGLLKAAHALLQDNRQLALSCTDAEKIHRAADNLLRREIRHRRGSGAVEHRRFLSAVTPKGLLCCTDTVRRLCPRIYLLRDPYGAAGVLFMNAIRHGLSQRGFEMYTCLCPLEAPGTIEHILVPELGLGFVTAGGFLPLEKALEPYRTLHFTRFTDMENLQRKKQRMRFNKRTAAELLEEAVHALQRAKGLHDKLEQYYQSAMDYEKIDERTEKVLARLQKRCSLD